MSKVKERKKYLNSKEEWEGERGGKNKIIKERLKIYIEKKERVN